MLTGVLLRRKTVGVIVGYTGKRTALFMEKPIDLSQIPSGMDNDPAADAEVINQQRGDSIPSTIAEPKQDDDDELANSIAYALDGSGAGLPGSTPEVGSEQTVVTEGTTGADPSGNI